MVCVSGVGNAREGRRQAMRSAKELSSNETVKSGGTGILPVSAQHGQDGHATSSAAVLLLFARLANNTVLILDTF